MVLQRVGLLFRGALEQRHRNARQKRHSHRQLQTSRRALPRGRHLRRPLFLEVSRRCLWRGCHLENALLHTLRQEPRKRHGTRHHDPLQGVSHAMVQILCGDVPPRHEQADARRGGDSPQARPQARLRPFLLRPRRRQIRLRHQRGRTGARVAEDPRLEKPEVYPQEIRQNGGQSRPLLPAHRVAPLRRNPRPHPRIQRRLPLHALRLGEATLGQETVSGCGENHLLAVLPRRTDDALLRIQERAVRPVPLQLHGPLVPEPHQRFLRRLQPRLHEPAAGGVRLQPSGGFHLIERQYDGCIQTTEIQSLCL